MRQYFLDALNGHDQAHPHPRGKPSPADAGGGSSSVRESTGRGNRGEVSNEAEIHDRVNQTLLDLLVVTLDDSGKRPAICDAVLHAHPRVRIIAVSSAQNRSICYWAVLQIQSKNIEPSEESMLIAARSMAAAAP